ncbi:hypothetical protein BT93_L1793 [Corymbia citriodora subsp. variegata]|uniref:Uncharacterized protein n=1 Tax=Corymbia citriodora subsp. variegata TaxID=360336 RepID=A0A8T0CRT6_CORYI|nr:hypothetical protein BT93_L1793 [Corymbia citriodora subsp. variegata]
MMDTTKHPYPPCYNVGCASPQCCVDPLASSCFEWPELVGQSGEKAKALIEKDNVYVTVILIPVGKAIGFLDFCCNRVYVWIDKKGNVYQTPVVG